MQIVLFNPDICTLLLRYRQRDDRLCRANVLLPDFSQPVIEALSFDAVFRAPLRDSQSACLLCFELFRPFPQAYILFHCCDCCCGFRLHTDSSSCQSKTLQISPMTCLGLHYTIFDTGGEDAKHFTLTFILCFLVSQQGISSLSFLLGYYL